MKAQEEERIREEEMKKEVGNMKMLDEWKSEVAEKKGDEGKNDKEREEEPNEREDRNRKEGWEQS